MSYLLDVNVLIARSDPNHIYHQSAVDWFQSIGDQLIATCPIVENGFVRIFGNPNYPGGPGSVQKALRNLQLIRALPRHRFIEDHLSLDHPEIFSDFKFVTIKQLTDVYLLGLAADKGLKFATFDSRIRAKAVAGGKAALQVIEG